MVDVFKMVARREKPKYSLTVIEDNVFLHVFFELVDLDFLADEAGTYKVGGRIVLTKSDLGDRIFPFSNVVIDCYATLFIIEACLAVYKDIGHLFVFECKDDYISN